MAAVAQAGAVVRPRIDEPYRDGAWRSRAGHHLGGDAVGSGGSRLAVDRVVKPQ
jgi:hypothetical protein